MKAQRSWGLVEGLYSFCFDSVESGCALLPSHLHSVNHLLLHVMLGHDLRILDVDSTVRLKDSDNGMLAILADHVVQGEPS